MLVHRPIDSTPKITMIASGNEAIRSRHFFVAVSDSRKMEPAADSCREGFAGTVPKLVGDTLVRERDNGP